jgi:DnaJ-class molecular chaperone
MGRQFKFHKKLVKSYTWKTCPKCAGYGIVDNHKCFSCLGRGRIHDNGPIETKI